MKIQIASDLHLERMTPKFPGYRAIAPADADLLIIAGDIHHGDAAIAAFADWPVPVLYVHGNHEAYHAQYPQAVDDIGRSAHASGQRVRHLENAVAIQGNVRFLGCCLWTDYALQQEGTPALTLDAAMEQAGNILFDHRVITMPGDALFTPHDALQLHRRSRAWLEQELARPFDGKTVVITHHGPHPRSIHERFAGSPLNPASSATLRRCWRRRTCGCTAMCTTVSTTRSRTAASSPIRAAMR